MSQSRPCLWACLPQSSRSPRDRYKHACCSHDAHVYVLGGRGSGCLRDFWRYNVVCNEWTELSCCGESAPEELEEHSMVAHEGFLYVFGGMLDSAFTSGRFPLWTFDTMKQKWVQCRGKTSPAQTKMPVNRKGHSAVVLGSAMLVYGGLVDMKGSSQDFWSLDFDTMSWSLLSSSQPGSPGPGPRHSHSAVVHQSCMFLFGGLKGLREQRDLWRWSCSTHTWTALRNKSGPSRLVGHSAVVYQDGMLLFGGGESQNSPDNSLWRYSFDCQSWARVAALPGSNAPEKIHHCCVGLGPSYRTDGGSFGSGLADRLPDERIKHFKNRCCPAPLTFLGSEGAIELDTFSLDRSYGRTLSSEPTHKDSAVPEIRSCLTFENKAFRRQCTEEEEEDDDDMARHLPDLLLVLGGKPVSSHGPISIWQMTLTDP